MYQKAVQQNDARTCAVLERQVLDPTSRHYGGIVDEVSGIPRPSHVGTTGDMATLSASLLNPDSKHYHSPEVLRSLRLCSEFMLAHQHEDGTISLGSTNFNSPPDTAFVVTGLAQIHAALRQDGWEQLNDVTEKVRSFLERTIPAMVTGGCHTPNHRWVIAAALAWLHHIFGTQGLVERASEWLDEGIDCTEDGEWTERSNGIYNAVSDISFYHIATLLNKPELLDHVRRNLRMMMYLAHPDGTVETAYSGRQDVGSRHGLSSYELIYRLMAYRDKDPVFASMADWAASTAVAGGAVNNHVMLGYVLYPFIKLEDVPRAPLPDTYEKVINAHHPISTDLDRMSAVGHHGKVSHTSLHTSFGAPLVRYRNHETSASIMSHCPYVFSLRHGRVGLLGVKIITSFSPGVVEMERLDCLPDGYMMSTTLQKGYNGPIPRASLPEQVVRGEISPWYLLPHHLRPLTHEQKHDIHVAIERRDSGWRLHLKTDDRPDVFTQVCFLFDSNVQLSGSEVKCLDKGTHFWMGNSLRASAGDDCLEIATGAHEHWLRDIRASVFEANVQAVLVNLLTPVDKVFDITFVSP